MKSSERAVFRLHPPEGYEWVVVADPARMELAPLRGVPLARGWQPPTVHIVDRDDGRSLAYSDTPWMGRDAIVMRPRAHEVLRSALAAHGEFLPLACAEADLTLFNGTVVIDALDEAASRVVRFPTGRIMDVRRYVFIPERLDGLAVFKIPQVPTLFLTESLASEFAKADLRGAAEVRQVWGP